MRHLFIVNPICAKVKGAAEPVLEGINDFMSRHPHIAYDTFITRWPRDALGYCRKYIQGAGGETVRVHSMGGTSTTFEIVNAIVDLPNAQIACYPMGRKNVFLHYFGLEKQYLFASVERQVLSEVIPIDAIRCNHNYGINNVLIGFEAYVDDRGDRLIEKTHLPSDICFTLVAIPELWKGKIKQNYKVRLDGKELDGEYVSIMAANQPWYGEGLSPAIDARPDDGVFDVYMSKDSNRLLRIVISMEYLRGRYGKYPEYITRHTGRKLEIESDRLMWLSVDGETFYGNKIECELLPGAIRFVYPAGDSGRRENDGA